MTISTKTMSNLEDNNPHRESSLEAFLKEEGIYDEVMAAATKRAEAEIDGLTQEEIWNGHAWALRLHAKEVGPMYDAYDAYSAEGDLRILDKIIQHAEWLHVDIKTRYPDARAEYETSGEWRWIPDEVSNKDDS